MLAVLDESFAVAAHRSAPLAIPMDNSGLSYVALDLIATSLRRQRSSSRVTAPDASADASGQS
jgi:hypothetical protein